MRIHPGLILAAGRSGSEWCGTVQPAFQGFGVLTKYFKPVLLVLLGLVLAAAPASAAPSHVILAVGDSLTAGYGLPQDQSFPAQLQAALKARGMEARVINAGVSGDTSRDGRARLDWVLSGLDAPPGLVILELGANDALRGLDPAETRANLAAILATLKARKLKVLLEGMKAPPNMGPRYARAFNGIYPALAKAFHVALDPFYLAGVAAEPGLNQADGMHPNARGVAVIVKRLAPDVARLLAARPKP